MIIISRHAKHDRNHAAHRSAHFIDFGTFLRLVMLYVFTRMVIMLIGLLSPHFVEPGQFAQGPEAYTITKTFLRWDCGWYLGIIKGGYFYDPTAQSNVQFFPAYPLLARSLHLLGLGEIASGYLVSNLTFLVAVFMLWALVRDLYGKAIAWMTVLLLLVGPVTFFFSTIYSEALFMLGIVGAFYASYHRRWAWAGLFGLLAALTRSTGILLVAPLLVEFLQLSPTRPYIEPSRPFWKIVFCFGPLAGLGLYMLYLWYAFDNPVAFVIAASHWGRAITFPWHSVVHAFHYSTFYTVWFLGALVLAWLLWGLGFWQRLRFSHLIFVGIFTLFYMSTSILESIPRYLSVLFPLYICLAKLIDDHPRYRWPIVAASSTLLIISITLYVNGYWFT